MPLLFRFELFDLKVEGRKRRFAKGKMALSRGVPKREKPRNEARSADYTGKVAVPPPLLSFFLKYAPPTFSTSSTFRAARERCVCVCVYACQGQDPVEENEGKKISSPSSHRERLFSLDDS